VLALWEDKLPEEEGAYQSMDQADGIA